MPLALNIVTDFSAVGNGSTNNTTAFANFNTYAVANQGSDQVILTIPAGTFLIDPGGTTTQFWAANIKNLLVQGAGLASTILTNGSSTAGFQLAGEGLYQDNTHFARVQTVAAGASSVTLITSGDASKFSANTWALMTGFCLQGQWSTPFGYPINPAFFQYVYITSIVGSVITFLSPLTDTYKSTWPLYNGGSGSEIDSCGPATLYVLKPTWDTVVDYRDLTINQPNRQTYANGRSITFRNCKSAGGFGLTPTSSKSWSAINVDITETANIEIDKITETATFTNCQISSMDCQSASVGTLNINNCTITTINGTPQYANLSNSTITTFRPGTTVYGRTKEIVVSNCAITTINPQGSTDKGAGDVGVNNDSDYSMAGGLIRIANTHGAIGWATPGAHCFWRGQYESETRFQVIDVTQDATYTYIRTSLNGGFPAVPRATGTVPTGPLWIYAHPAPTATFTSCTGSADAIDLSQMPARTPLYSYSRRTYTPNNMAGVVSAQGPGGAITMWGNLVALKINVSTAFTGTGALQFNLSQFNNWHVLDSVYADQSYGPNVNARIAGERSITRAGVSGTQSLDTNLTVPDAIQTWFPEAAPTGGYLSANVTAQSSSTWPTITVEITTDQGITPENPLRDETLRFVAYMG